MKNSMVSLILISLILLFTNRGYSQSSKYLEFEPTAFKGSFAVEQVYSPALEGNLLGDPSTQPVKVYLPPGYHDFPENEYPVLYLLHGYTWDYNTYYASHDLLNKLNDLIARKIIAPMIVVTPNAKNKYDGSMYANSYVCGNWEDYIAEDVVKSIESKYRALKQAESRAISGFSMGGYGATILAMKHPSVFNTVSIMAGASLNVEDKLKSPWKDHIMKAIELNSYRPNDRWEIRAVISAAASFAPDSTASPILGRFPFNKDSTLIDTIWQRYVLHDPITMLNTYKDSLLKLGAIHMFMGENDTYHPGHEPFHNALVDHGIEHGYLVVPGDHNVGPVLDTSLIFIGTHLEGHVPGIYGSFDFYLEKTESLLMETDMDGKLLLVPYAAGNQSDSIYKYQVAAVDVMANEENTIPLSDYEYGRYNVYAQGKDSMISNIPLEFFLVPDKDPMDLKLESDTVIKGNPISLKSDRDGTFCLVIPNASNDTLHTVYEIMTTRLTQETFDAVAGTEVSISTKNLAIRTYLIYFHDQYGIVSSPKSVEVIAEPVSTHPDAIHQSKVKIFPNPAKELIMIESQNNGMALLEISSINGQLVYSGMMEGTSQQIDLSSFKKGVYFITISAEDYIITRKIIKL